MFQTPFFPDTLLPLRVPDTLLPDTLLPRIVMQAVQFLFQLPGRPAAIIRPVGARASRQEEGVKKSAKGKNMHALSF
jgi:hypothetical protein